MSWLDDSVLGVLAVADGLDDAEDKSLPEAIEAAREYLQEAPAEVQAAADLLRSYFETRR
jgi:hypothetical protein